MSEQSDIRMRFDHVSIAVHSIDRAIEFFQRYFPVNIRNERRRDDQVSGSFHWQDLWLGGFAVEFIEDLPGQQSFVSKFIARHGEGLHHLSIEVDRLAPVVERLRRGGVRVVDEQTFPDGSATAFISPRSAFGALVQFWQVTDFDGEHKQRPAPDGLAHFDHVSLAVREVPRALDFFTRYFAPIGQVRQAHRSHSQGNFMIGDAEIAGFKLEFIQSPPNPVENDFVARFIAKYGEGMHHISVDLKEFDATRERLKKSGVRVVDERTNDRGERQFFISPRDAFGVLIQVWDGV